MDFVAQEYWDQGYAALALDRVDAQDPIRIWIETHFKGTSGSCFEVGCFPGRYLGVFGELGYEVNGIDLTPRVSDDFPQYLEGRGFKVGQFTQGDFLKTEPNAQFDVVCSFGFIEHYSNWDEVIKKHFEWLKPGGHLVLETPNFKGAFQYLLHRLVDQKNLRRHNTASMVPLQWAQLTRDAGFEVIQAGYLGTFLFWEDQQDRNIFQKIALKGIRVLAKILPRALPEGLPAFAPFCALIARKPI
jgi:2-polyprenyl-3-methyl-5-hydroxy-6-metoxy-1,4-benzoquinol methylase